jgi:hypothetical protein
VSSHSDPHDAALVRLSFCAGMGLGLILALVLAWRWTDAGSGTRIQVLGAGKYASVLITNEQRRVLIASGSNGSAFSNAISAALPAIGKEIDVLLIDPRSSNDVIERARSLDAKRAIVLPGAKTETQSGRALRSFTIEMSSGVGVSVRIEPTGAWTALVTTSAGILEIAPGESVTTEPISISLDGSFKQASSVRQVRIGPATNGLARTPTVAAVSAGSVLSIEIDGSTFRIPRSYFAANPLSEGADHLTRLDRKLLLELGPHRRAEILIAQYVQAGQGHRLGDANRVFVAHV